MEPQEGSAWICWGRMALAVMVASQQYGVPGRAHSASRISSCLVVRMPAVIGCALVRAPCGTRRHDDIVPWRGSTPDVLELPFIDMAPVLLVCGSCGPCLLVGPCVLCGGWL